MRYRYKIIFISFEIYPINQATYLITNYTVTGGDENTLTLESLQRHNELNSGAWPVINRDIKSIASQDSVADAESASSYNESLKTYNTFASEWSCCSNVSFNKLVLCLSLKLLTVIGFQL